MSALGGFAKGLSDGLASGQQFRLNDQRAENEQKRMGWEQKDQDYKAQDRARQDAIRKETADVIAGLHPDVAAAITGQAPQQDTTAVQQPIATPDAAPVATPDAATAVPAGAGNLSAAAATPPAAPAGNVGTAAPSKPAPLSPLDFATQNAAAASKLLGITLKYGNADPQTIIKMKEMADEASKTQLGRTVLAAYNGDQKAMAAVAQHGGLDPNTVKFVHPTNDTKDPDYNKFLLVDGAGKKMDMTAFTIGTGVYNTTLAPIAESEGRNTQSKVGNLQAQHTQKTVDNYDSDHALEVKGKNADITLKGAEATLAGKRGNLADAKATAAAGSASKASSKEFLSALKQIVPPGDDGKPDTNAAGLIQHIASQKYGDLVNKNPVSAASSAKKDYDTVASQADQWIAKQRVNKDAYKAMVQQYGGPDKLRAAVISKGVVSQFGEPTAGNGNVSYDPETDI